MEHSPQLTESGLTVEHFEVTASRRTFFLRNRVEGGLFTLGRTRAV